MLTRFVGAVRSHVSLLGSDELVNVLTHGLGLLGAAVGCMLLVGFAFLRADMWTFVGVTIYAVCIVFLFAASTVYHSSVSGPLKQRMRRVDHLGVKLLIAGTYTPFVMAELRDGPAMWIGPAVWTLVALGITLQIMLTEEGYYRVSLPLYLAMGFVCAPFYQEIVDTLPQDALWMLAAGGAAYLVGVLFFVWESLPYSHGVWHCFVIIGAVLHFAAIATCSVLA
jgi:hemolysin III